MALRPRAAQMGVLLQKGDATVTLLSTRQTFAVFHIDWGE
jgi:hypothetical protein